MPGTGHTSPQGNTRKVKRVDFELAVADGRGHDIDDGIRGSDLVKVDLIGRYAVDFSLNFGQAVKNADAGFFYLGAQPAADRKSTRLNSSHRTISYAVL